MSEWKETEIGKMPAEWALKKIKEISERVSVGYVGITSKYFTNDSDGIPLLRSQNIRNGKINFDNLLYITKEFHYANKKSILQSGDVLVVRVGENRGDTCILKNEFKEVNCANIVFFRPQKEYGKFIELFLRSPYGQFTLEALTTGSAQGVINTTSIAEISVPLPSMEEAVEISALFESIENKIDLLHRQNKTLEQLAETLFRQWFVEEADKNEEIILGDYVQRINGYSYNSTELKPSEVALVTLKSFNRDGSFRMDGFKEFIGKIKEHQTVKQGDLVVAHTDITQEADVIGNPVLVIEHPKYKTLVITMDCVKVVPKDERFSIPFLYFLMKTREFKFYCLGCSNGTTVLHLSKEAIPSFTFPKPDFKKVKIFTEQAKEIIQKQFNNHSQIQNLTQLRDTLLPKLMSGEVRVNKI